MEQRGQFTFYESFYGALQIIKDDADRAKAYDAICAYALYGTEPDLDALPDSAAIAFVMAKPNMDSSRRKASSGKKGGEAKKTASDVGDSNEEANGKQTGSKPEAKPKQGASKKENEKENKKENECYNPLAPSQEEKFSPLLLDAVRKWLRYKHERKEDYTPTGLEAMTSEICNRADKHGESAVIDLIEQCMASNWKGIVWDKLSPSPKGKNPKYMPGTGGATTHADESAKEDLERMQQYLERQRRGEA